MSIAKAEMDWKKLFLTAFGIIFLSELGDKTQVTTMLLASEKPLYVLYVALGSAMALVTTSFIEVAIGSTLISKFCKEQYIRIASGLAFLVMSVLLWFRFI